MRRDFFDLYVTLQTQALGIAECFAAMREVFRQDVNEALQRVPRPDPRCWWSMVLQYRHRFRHRDGRGGWQHYEFGPHGCFLGLDFRNIDEPDPRGPTWRIPKLGVQAHWWCALSGEGSPGLREAFGKIVTEELSRLGPRGRRR